MSLLDFQASQRRLKERAKAATDKALAKADRERAAAERARVREEAREEEARLRRLEAARREEEERVAREQELEANNGVFYHSRLQSVYLSETVPLGKGVKRAADKLLLPPSAGAQLLDQGAMKNGAYFFELRHPSGRRTHAGLLEFTGAEGFVALSRKVVRCLLGPNIDPETACEGAIEVAYRRLPKATKVVFQPRSAEFQKATEDCLRESLEAALLQHSALTVGDWIEVQAAGRTWDLRVRELHPADAASVIDTEVEAEVHPSVETEERLLAEEMEARRRMEEAAEAARAAADAAAAEEAERGAAAARRREFQALKAMSLPPEPAEQGGTGGGGESGVITCVVRFPDGSRHTRRFLASQPVGLLFDFVDSKGAGGEEPGTYKLVTQYPRHVFEPAEGGVLIGSMPVTGRHVLFLERAAAER